MDDGRNCKRNFRRGNSIYVRSISKGLKWLRRVLEETGVKAGGKDHVVYHGR